MFTCIKLRFCQEKYNYCSCSLLLTIDFVLANIIYINIFWNLNKFSYTAHSLMLY